VVTRTQQWLQQENLNGFTVQLAIFNATDNPNDYLQSVLAQLPPTQVFASQSMYKAALHTSVFYGSFTSFADAARAIENLPAALRGNKPSVRSWVKIKMEQTS
jgi:septal ring-binding cell division protein DamX